MAKICVIGGAAIDICGASVVPLRDFDSNPGEISISYGGVGRNIAQIIGMLDRDLKFVTCFSSDNYGSLMKEDCEKLGMDCSMSKIVDDLPSAMYIAILNEDHDMNIAMSDMRILDHLDEETIDRALATLNEEDYLVLDANLSKETLEHIAKNAKCHVAADPVSANKCKRLEDVLEHIDVFKPNQFEASEFTGIWIEDDETARANLDWFLDHGVKEIIISMADRGVLLGTREEKVWFTHRSITLNNATGGGDSFMGTYVAERAEGRTPVESVRCAITAAVNTIENDAVRRRSLNEKTILDMIEATKIAERRL